jgi:hypothetical protein
MKPLFTFTGAWAVACAAQLVTTANAASVLWKEKSVSPVTNPLFFEDPNITTEVRPIFAYHRIGNDLLNGLGLNGISEGDVRVYALQLRYALTDRLALIATKDGYTDIKFDHPALAGFSKSGFNDLAAGVKYAFIKDEAKEFILTGGLKIELPTGNSDVFQGNGSGEWDVFAASAKNWGNFRAVGNLGVRLPNDFSAESSSAHYSVQFDYYACKYFIPFVSANGHTVLTSGNSNFHLPAGGLNVEGFDLVNFGADSADGRTQIVGGIGFRSRVHQNVDFGFAYEKSLTSPDGLFKDRVTVDLVFHF